jgi:ABC-2 type transport system permease protein
MMSADTAALPAAPRPRPAALRRLTLTELTLFMRERVGAIWGVGFPLVLLIIFGNIPGFRKPVSVANARGVSILDSYVPVLLAFVLAMIALNVLPPVLAGYREKGVLRRLSATPVGVVRVLTAQLIVDAGMTAVTMIALLVVARLAFGVDFPRQVAEFVLAVVLSAVALLGLGLFLAAVLPTGRAANAAGAILFFPMMFFAGLWLPIAAMPAVLRHVSHATPLGAAVQAMTDAWQGHWHPLYLLILAGYALVFAVAAARLFRWE